MDALQTSSHEKLLAALAHAAVILQGAGAAVPLVIWHSQRGKSRYVTVQAMQALWWQSLLAVYFQLALLLISIIYIAVTGATGTTAQPSRALVIGLLAGLALSLLLYSLAGLAGAAACLLGRNFAYPWLGPRVRRALLAGSLPAQGVNPAAEERLVAGAAHAGMFMPLIGMLVPLLAWVLPRPNTPFLRYHALQALLFQGLSTLLSLAVSVILLTMSTPLVILALGIYNHTLTSPSALILTLILLVLILLFSLLAALAVPVFSVFAFFAMVKVPQGKEYRYPLVGRLKWVVQSAARPQSAN